MEIIKSGNSDGMVLRLNGEVTVDESGKLKDEILAAKTGSPKVELDIDEVTNADTSGLQLLFAAKKTSGITLTGHSDAIKAAFERTGIRL